MLFRSRAKMECQKAKTLAADPTKVDCVAGERVYVRVEVIASMDPKAEAHKGLRLLRKTWHKRKVAKYPARALTVLGNTGVKRCLGGKVQRDRGDGTFWKPKPWGICCGEGCSCAGPRCARICPSHVFAGDSCDARICRKWPKLKGCSQE